MRVSVIIPTFNRIETLGRALESVARQTRPPDHIIVVDDGSTDGTTAWLAVQDGIETITQPNRGVSAARNVGIQRALEKGAEWIALLDSDDAWEPQKLERQVDLIQTLNAAMEPLPPPRLVHTDEIWIRNGRRVNPAVKHAKPHGQVYRHCLPLCCISPSSVLIHREVFEEVGLFDESLPACEDYDLWLRICARYPVHLLDAPLTIKYGGHADQLSRTHWGMDRFRVTALRKMIDSDILTPEDRSATIEMLNQKLDILIAGALKRDHRQNAETFSALKMEQELVDE